MRTLTLAIVAMTAAACSSGTSGSTSSTSAGSSTGAPQICTPGQPVACVGQGEGCMQTCSSDGTSYTPCLCATSTGTSGTGGSTGTSGGQTGATGSTSGGSGTSGGASSSGTTTGAAAFRIGQVCGATKPCPGTQDCYAINGSNGFCTISCGEGDLEPPDGGEQLCAETPALGGTPACESTLSTANSDGGGYTFYCALLCGHLAGPDGGVDEGTCPAGLTCTENICE